MKRRLIYGLMALPLCFLFFVFGVNSKDELNVGKKIESPPSQRHMTIVVASYKNEAFYHRNLDSIFSQEYQNFDVVYIDDASPDQTYEKVKDYIHEKGVQDKLTLIHNGANCGALYNYYKAIHELPNDDIVVILDGDDWFAHPRVLADLNSYYANDDVWMTYGRYIRHPDGEVGLCSPVTKAFLKKGEIRKGEWRYSHLRTFYAGLFKRISLEDLLQDGKFFQVTCDLAMMFPMLEMAREHAVFTPEISYVYNYANPLNDARVKLALQEEAERCIRMKPPYPKLNRHPAEQLAVGKVDLVIFSFNRPMQLYALLESIEQHVTGLREIAVLYRSDDEFEKGYEEVSLSFPSVIYKKQSKESPKEDFKPLTNELAFKKGSDYIVFAVDDIIVTDKINLLEGITRLEETGAWGLFYRLGSHLNYCYILDKEQKVPDLLDVGNGSFAWEFSRAELDWNYPNSVDFVLYRKSDIQSAFEKLKFTQPNFLEGKWAKLGSKKKVGICYHDTKIINIPVNRVTIFENRHANIFTPREMNELFLKGKKIDIAPLYQIKNSSVHVEIEPTFVERCL